MFISSLLSSFSFQVSSILIPYNLFHLQLFNVMILLLVYNIKDFQFQITIFFYYPSLWYQSNKSLPNNAWGLCPRDLLEFYSSGFYVQAMDPFPLTFCVWFWQWSNFNFLQVDGCSICPVLFVESIIFPPMNGFGTFWKTILPNRWNFTSECCCIGFLYFFHIVFIIALP